MRKYIFFKFVCQQDEEEKTINNIRKKLEESKLTMAKNV